MNFQKIINNVFSRAHLLKRRYNLLRAQEIARVACKVAERNDKLGRAARELLRIAISRNNYESQLRHRAIVVRSLARSEKKEIQECLAFLHARSTARETPRCVRCSLTHTCAQRALHKSGARYTRSCARLTLQRGRK